MNLNVYQTLARERCLPTAFNHFYLTLGLASEAGEVAGKAAKQLRDGAEYSEFIQSLKQELGDVLWFVAVLAWYHGIELEAVAESNLSKLQDRAARGVIGGSGDER